IAAPIRDRGQKLVQQVPMRRMDLEHLHLCGERACCSRLERVNHADDARVVERHRCLISSIEWKRTWCDDRRPAARGRIEWSAAFPWSHGAGLSTCVCELRPKHCTMCTNEAADACECFDVLVLPKAEVLWTDASFGEHGCRFGEHEPRAA